MLANTSWAFFSSLPSLVSLRSKLLRDTIKLIQSASSVQYVASSISAIYTVSIFDQSCFQSSDVIRNEKQDYSGN